MPRRRPDKEKKVSKARVKSEPKHNSGSAPKPYLRVPEEFLASQENAGVGEENNLPQAENLFRKHLFNQSLVNGW